MEVQMLNNPQSLSPATFPFPEDLQDACFRAFPQCLRVSSQQIVKLINAVFGKDHALNNEVLFPDLQLSRDTFPNHMVSVLFRIVEKQGKTRTFTDYCLVFCPQFSKDLFPGIGCSALEQGWKLRHQKGS